MQTTRQQKMLAHKICDAQQSHMQVNLRRKMYKKKKRMESPYLVTILTTTLVYITCNHFLKNTTCLYNPLSIFQIALLLTIL